MKPNLENNLTSTGNWVCFLQQRDSQLLRPPVLQYKRLTAAPVHTGKKTNKQNRILPLRIHDSVFSELIHKTCFGETDAIFGLPEVEPAHALAPHHAMCSTGHFQRKGSGFLEAYRYY